MASVESASDARRARKAGWATFRILRSKDRPGKGETYCLAYSDGRQCRDCRLCTGRYRSVVIPAHGHRARDFGAADARYLLALLAAAVIAALLLSL